MIKIIKSGKKEFHAICPSCGCEFTYEMEDLSGKDYIGALDYVKCPECGMPISHLMNNTTPTPKSIDIYYKDTTRDNMQSNNPCVNCNYIKKLMTDHVYVGDTPCTWCEYNPLKVACTNVYTATNTNTDVTIDPSKTEGGGITFNNGKN